LVPPLRPHSTPQTDAIRRAVIAEGKSAASSKVKNKSSLKGKNQAPSKPVEEEKDSDDDFMPMSWGKSTTSSKGKNTTLSKGKNKAPSKPVEEEKDIVTTTSCRCRGARVRHHRRARIRHCQSQ
jgi:hypothetical protein